MTRMPLRFSRTTWLIRSILTCIDWKSGIAWERRAPTITPMSGTMTTRRPDSGTSSRRAMTIPPTAMIGAEIIIVRARATTVWTCWTSFVLRVMSDAVPKWFVSVCENASTLRNTALRTSRPKAMAVLEPQ